MEHDGLRLDFAFLDIDFVASEDDWDIFANTHKVTWSELVAMSNPRIDRSQTVPVGNTLVGDA